MKKLLIGCIGVPILLVILAAVIGFMLPTAYSIERTITIDGSSAEIHEYLEDLRKWPEWAPWEEQDPTIVTTYGEQTTGVGASQSWTADSGNGELTLTASDPETGIAYDFAFIVGEVRAPSTCAMSYAAADGGGTTVVWTMDGDVGDMMPGPIAGYMNMAMGASIGGMFDRGLENLKGLVETD